MNAKKSSDFLTFEKLLIYSVQECSDIEKALGFPATPFSEILKRIMYRAVSLTRFVL